MLSREDTGSAALGARLPRDREHVFPRATQGVECARRVRYELRHGQVNLQLYKAAQGTI